MNTKHTTQGPQARRQSLVNDFLKLLHPWTQALSTNGSCAYWCPADEVSVAYPESDLGDQSAGTRIRPPVPTRMRTASGQPFDGITRMLPAIAAWTACPENPDTNLFSDGSEFCPKEFLVSAISQGTDPKHPDFWLYCPSDRLDQRQIEASCVALSLWLAKDWIFEKLTPAQIADLARWIDSSTVFDRHYNNFKMFVALTEAAKVSLAQFGFHGDVPRVIRLLKEIDTFAAGDGWLWDFPRQGIDYYNFWVNGAYHCYIHAMLGDVIGEAILSGLDQRLDDLFRLFDSKGRSVLIGRSLPYRWGMLIAPAARLLLPEPPFPPSDLCRLLLKNIAAWLDLGVLKPSGLLSERLTLDGSESGRECYINAGHPYWCMQAFLPLAWGTDHDFWSEPSEKPASVPPEIVTRSQVGLIIQKLPGGREVRLYQTPNLSHVPVFHAIEALYSKLLYSTAYGANVGGARFDDLLDNELGLFGKAGTRLICSLPVESTVEGSSMGIQRLFPLDGGAGIRVASNVRVLPDGYEVSHEIVIPDTAASTFVFIEGGFPMPFKQSESPPLIEISNVSGKAVALNCWVSSAITSGWQEIDGASFQDPTAENLIAHRAAFFRLRAELGPGAHSLSATHLAEYP